MEDNKEKKEEVQGTKTVETKKPKVSPSYTVRQYGTMIEKLKTMEMIDDGDEKQLKAIGQKIINRFLGLDMFK